MKLILIYLSPLLLNRIIHSTSNTYIIIALINYLNTGSITKLQKAMGHSSINVSLTYLRGLEIAELKEEDMPMV